MVTNSIEITDAKKEDFLFILSHLRDDDKRKVAWEKEKFELNDDSYVNLWLSFPHKFTARIDGKILFSAGVIESEEVNNEFALFWMPTMHADSYKKSYGRASLMMVDKLKTFGKPIWDLFPTWYEKNVRPAKRLGFIPQKTVNICGQDFILSKLEV